MYILYVWKTLIRYKRGSRCTAIMKGVQSTLHNLWIHAKGMFCIFLKKDNVTKIEKENMKKCRTRSVGFPTGLSRSTDNAASLTHTFNIFKLKRFIPLQLSSFQGVSLTVLASNHRLSPSQRPVSFSPPAHQQVNLRTRDGATTKHVWRNDALDSQILSCWTMNHYCCGDRWNFYLSRMSCRVVQVHQPMEEKISNFQYRVFVNHIAQLKFGYI